MDFDSSLFRPGYIVRPKQAFYGDGKLHSSTGIRRKEFLPDRNVQHAPENPKFLVHGCGFELLPLDEPCGRLDAHPVAKALAEIELNLVGI